jgi:hydrogenase maturation protein HypF
MGLKGWVCNTAGGVVVEAEGTVEALERFLDRIDAEKPPRSFLESIESAFLDTVGYASFEIRESRTGRKTASVMPDIATCPACLREVFDPANRRYRYPFTNCTHCGPRFSIIRSLPYDRCNTSMSSFDMCDDCRAEYEDPADRRFHAQPNACPVCGPQLSLWNCRAETLEVRDEALLAAAEAIRGGKIVAVKGIGGFHLLANAADEEAVLELRRRKKREEKPLAVLFPNMEAVSQSCTLSPGESRALRSPESPIVLVLRKQGECTRVSESVAPGHPSLGILLPYSPLHHLLMAELGFPVVATSGNLSEEPICIDNEEAIHRLGGIADLFLVHDRPIVRHVDDSIVRLIAGREMVLRRARGYAPLPICVKTRLPSCIGVGASLKNSVAAATGKNVFISQHIGDLETTESYRAFERTLESLNSLYDFAPTCVAHDLHPEYLSTRYAEACGLPLVGVQHHYAHILSCMAENEVEGTVLGVAWDGTGLGTDGTIWGGEFLRTEMGGFERVACFRPFRLPGGDAAVREPRRSALGLFFEMFGSAIAEDAGLLSPLSFSSREVEVLLRMMERRINSPLSTSAGRLFDVVAAMTGIRAVSRFEGQAAMDLEFLVEDDGTGETYAAMDLVDPPEGSPPCCRFLDWEPMIRQIWSDLSQGVPAGTISSRFHNTLVEAIVQVARYSGEEKVALSGGCFQNKYLTERAIRRLKEEGFQVYWHQRVPPNDGGIALGQVVAAWA